MQVTVSLSEKQIAFLKQMVIDMNKYEHISTMEEAINECIDMSMYEDGEHAAVQEKL